MQLKDTIEKMIDGGYKERFIAEYEQLCIRLLKLQNLLTLIKGGEADFSPDSPIEILEAQEEVMSTYKTILEKRAYYEKIILPEVEL